MLSKPRPILANTPAALPSSGGRRFLLFNVSRLCNQNCPFCWTSETAQLIRAQSRPESIEWFSDWALGALLSRFKKTGGRVVAVMSQGEPLVGINYEFIQRLAKMTGSLDLGLLVFTNGENLTQPTLERLDQCSTHISYSISVNGGSKDVYDSLQGKKGAFERTMANKTAWKEYNTRLPHRVAIHTVITSASSESELELIRQLVVELGGIPWIVTTMGNAGSARANPSIRPDEATTEALIKRYATGPTATGAEEKTCSYISSSWHENSMYGLTLHPFNKGAVQACPYLSGFGTGAWFNLKQFLEEKNRNEDDVALWLDYATLIQSLITTAAFQVVGYESCLMRHEKIKTIESFLATVNSEMSGRSSTIRTTSSDYFEAVVRDVSDSLALVADRHFGKKATVDPWTLRKTLDLEHLLPHWNAGIRPLMFRKKHAD